MAENVESSLLFSIKNTFHDMAGKKVELIENKQGEVHFTNVFIIESFQPEELCLQFFFPLEAKRLLVESILKENWFNLSHEYIDDCLLEIVNIIGGNFFCRYFNPRRYEISLPQLTFDDRGISRGEMYYFETEGILFAVSLASY